MIASEKAIRGETIASPTRELYSSQAGRTNYDMEDVIGIIPEEDLFNVLVVNKSKLDRFVRDRPELKDSLSKIAKISYNAPTYRVRETKVDNVSDNNNSNAA